MLKKVYEGLNARKCIWRLKCAKMYMNLRRSALRSKAVVLITIIAWQRFRKILSIPADTSQVEGWLQGWFPCDISSAHGRLKRCGFFNCSSSPTYSLSASYLLSLIRGCRCLFSFGMKNISILTFLSFTCDFVRANTKSEMSFLNWYQFIMSFLS